MCKLLAQLSDHKRGQLPRSTGTLRQCGETRAQHLSVCELTLNGASDFPPVRFPTQREHQTPDTRRVHRTRSPSVPPFSIASGKIVTRPETQDRGPLEPSAVHKKLFLRLWQAHKSSTQRGSANTVITFQIGFRRPIGGEDCLYNYTQWV